MTVCSAVISSRVPSIRAWPEPRECSTGLFAPSLHVKPSLWLHLFAKMIREIQVEVTVPGPCEVISEIIINECACWYPTVLSGIAVGKSIPVTN